LKLEIRNPKTWGFIVPFLLFLIVFTTYLPALKNGFVWDDDSYVVNNSYIRSLSSESFWLILTGFHSGNWHPLTWFSHALDYAFWSLNPQGHHLTSLILHGLNTSLVFMVVSMLLTRILPWSSTLLTAVVTSLLFGLHPLRVESVAWVAERKDLLCGFFYLLSILFYLLYLSPLQGKRQRGGYVASLCFFLMALMSKPMAVTLPLTLLLLDWYPFSRWQRSLKSNLSLFTEKIPFFVLSIGAAIITLVAQHSGGAIRSLTQLGFITRLLNALRVPVFYLAKIAVPIELTPFYPFSLLSHREAIWYGMVVATITGFGVWQTVKGKKLWLTLWAYYLITLMPVIGIIQVGGQLAADRYTYLPSLAPSLLLGVTTSWLWEKVSWSKLAQAVRVLVVVSVVMGVGVCSYLTFTQIKVWNNPETLWGRVNGVFPGLVQEGYFNLGVYYSDTGRVDEAIEQFKVAIRINPHYVRAYNNLGITYTKKGMLNEAIAVYRKALSIDPLHEKAYYNLGNVYLEQGRFDEAIHAFKNAILINSDYTQAHYNLGYAYDKKGMWDEAIAGYERVLSLNSGYAEACNNLAVIYCYRKKDFTLAARYCKRAMELGYKVHPMLLDALKSSTRSHQ